MSTTLFGKRRAQSLNNNTKISRKKNTFAARFELLEQRYVLTSTLYLDFGDNFPAGGLAMTVDELQDSFGSSGLQGPNLVGDEDAGQPAIVAGTPLLFTGLSGLITFDYNGSGMVNATDYTDLRTDIISLVARYYSVFDLNIVIAPAVDNTTARVPRWHYQHAATGC